MVRLGGERMDRRRRGGRDVVVGADADLRRRRRGPRQGRRAGNALAHLAKGGAERPALVEKRGQERPAQRDGRSLGDGDLGRHQARQRLAERGDVRLAERRADDQRIGIAGDVPLQGPGEVLGRQDALVEPPAVVGGRGDDPEDVGELGLEPGQQLLAGVDDRRPPGRQRRHHLVGERRIEGRMQDGEERRLDEIGKRSERMDAMAAGEGESSAPGAGLLRVVDGGPGDLAGSVGCDFQRFELAAALDVAQPAGDLGAERAREEKREQPAAELARFLPRGESLTNGRGDVSQVRQLARLRCGSARRRRPRPTRRA